jgi:hypothetical protein
MSSLALSPSPEEIEDWRAKLLEVYLKRPRYADKAEEKVDGIIKKAIRGWRNAPKTFAGRCKSLSSYRNPRIKNLTHDATNFPVVREKRIQEQLSAAMESSPYADFYKKLSTEERKFIEAREKIYKFEFELNQSSDQSMLIQVLVEELVQYRISNAIAVADTGNLELLTELTRERSESAKRLQVLLVALGVTREQRKKVERSPDGNVAQLSMMLDDKLKRIKEIEAKDKENEEYYQQEKAARGETNIVTQEDLDGLSDASSGPLN